MNEARNRQFDNLLYIALTRAKSLGNANLEPEHLLLVELGRDSGGKLGPLLMEQRVRLEDMEAMLTRRLKKLPLSSSHEERDYSERLQSIEGKARGKDPQYSWDDFVGEILQSAEDPLHADLLRLGFRYAPALRRVQAGEPGQARKAASPLEYCTDLIALAETGKLEPVVGREKEIDAIRAILAQKKENNPLLVGDPGVGKTQIVEGLALRICRGEAGERLKGKRIYSLDLAALLAGAEYRGQFEERLRGIITAIRDAQGQIILFVDEIHTLVEAGKTTGSLDAGNMIKPALARGELRLIGATTFEEYRDHLEKDRAFRRRFRTIEIIEPSQAETLEILRSTRQRMEHFHGVTVEDQRLRQIVALSGSYIGDNQFPAKSLQLLDQVSAYVREIRIPRNGGTANITEEDVATVLSDITRIPREQILRKNAEDLGLLLRSSVYGQEAAIDAIVHALGDLSQLFRDARKPRGVFLFIGPHGSGKTHLVQELCRHLFQDPARLVPLDLAAYVDLHSVRRLTGADPGTIGYEQGGELTEPVRRRPFSLVMFHNCTSATRTVVDLLERITEDGSLRDAQGRLVNFGNAILVFMHTTSGSAVSASREDSVASLSEIDDLRGTLGSSLLGHMTFVSFSQLSAEAMRSIAHARIRAFGCMLSQSFGLGAEVTITPSTEALDFIVSKSWNPQGGAASVAHYLDSIVGPAIARTIARSGLPGNGHVQALQLHVKVTGTQEASELSYEVHPTDSLDPGITSIPASHTSVPTPQQEK